MSPKEAKELISSLFTEEGAEVNGIKIYAESPLTFEILNNEDDSITINFTSNQPKASIKRIFTISAVITSVTLKNEHGFFELKNFPSIPFPYDGFFSSSAEGADISGIQKVIDAKYCGQNKKIANLCLFYADEWAKISSQATCFKTATAKDKRKLKKQCVDFVTHNVKKEMEERHGSVILTYLLVFIVIPAIARFIITRLLEKYF